ncbi:polyribonucleotide nucleotidyltransferase [Listeria cossartiae subsp. cayugensis]|uniref:Polyribonucleotide nucleotidyltransferase n=1 Tax=Listeria cossartiae subsp. cayugensis TaxID=2713505 RepID=A0ABU2IJU4_9LIST|nr:polyribonucleotide nucleotidyltransferase [Listeria cossartiae]MBC1805705.1 polyribonucleotide nucleotidyltransferase [Listeria cossartiae subsp. cayugensis]MDT0048456.1 polyribonucleotide nucleotidyltransferase [Listeria cossartiae subsp. cayugensis]MDT0064959.1 polyribonucleotide nucleotidyltransferase [Listeria cossartiae subsp. cayugensis]MDT0079437.1 polyribonucleotide nucleotidyltransferase [Listeria cossartiae subsp. cayugensis]MDT0082273.1 polyribonucleotide nucleotidyltransferase [
MSEKQVFSTEWAGKTLSVEVGQLAKQASGAALIRYGDTVVLTAAVGSKKPRPGDFFPLTVNYEEKMYSVGKVPGGFLKREGRPSDRATLTARLIDRPIRPLFAEGFRNEVQITSTVFSVDQDCSPEMAAMLGSSVALVISDIPFEGPIAGVDVGRIDGKYVINPTIEQAEKSDISLTVAGTYDAINMVEAGAKEVSEEAMLEAIMFGHEEIKRLCEFQQQIIAAVGKEKREIELFVSDPELEAEVKAASEGKMKTAIKTEEKKAREAAIEDVKEEILESYKAKELENESEILSEVAHILEMIEKDEMRRLISQDKIRPDGRKVNEIRPLSSEVGMLPRVHGSGLFTRGQTQALSVCTLAPLREHQIIDGLGTEEYKRFMHHYNFPQFSVGETGPRRAPGRREIGHGALGERALQYVIPSEEEFPYTIRLVSEVLESNGSSSQASICGSTLAMLDAGVPIKAPVAGIAMGLVKLGDDYTILSDIQGMEDHFGDMDFKVAGTKDGITALQMDIKIDGLSRQILDEALTQAKEGRLHILEHLTSTISAPREELSAYAPKIITLNIKPEKIKDVIGPGGKQINAIIEETGVKIDIEQDGTVYIASQDQAMNRKAIAIIEDIVREVVVGEVYTGKVRRIEKFGAFVELFKGTDGLVHISELAHERVGKVEDILKLGDEVTVKVIEVDQQGRVNLSRKALLEKKEQPEGDKKPQAEKKFYPKTKKPESK